MSPLTTTRLDSAQGGTSCSAPSHRPRGVISPRGRFCVRTGRELARLVVDQAFQMLAENVRGLRIDDQPALVDRALRSVGGVRGGRGEPHLYGWPSSATAEAIPIIMTPPSPDERVAGATLKERTVGR